MQPGDSLRKFSSSRKSETEESWACWMSNATQLKQLEKLWRRATQCPKYESNIMAHVWKPLFGLLP